MTFPDDEPTTAQLVHFGVRAVEKKQKWGGVFEPSTEESSTMFRNGTRPRKLRIIFSRGGRLFRIPTATVVAGCLLIPLALVMTTIRTMPRLDEAAVPVTGTPEIHPSQHNTPLTPQQQMSPIQVEGETTTLPSAKSLLMMPPPFEDSQIIKLTDDLIKSPNTVVTGYFRVPSKYHPEKYDNWMKNMLSLQDAMIIFTQPDIVDQIKKFRDHAKNRTAIIPLEINQLPYATLYSQQFWEDQLERDPEKRIHRSYQLFWIWLSKSWLTTQAIRLNLYESDLFIWSDIGCFRDKKYNFEELVRHRDLVPPTEMMHMAHHEPNPPAEELFNDKYKRKPNFYHSGSLFAGYRDTWIKFHEYFLDTIDKFLAKKMIIVEDQAVLQSVCLSHPEICAYVPFNQVNDNHYFGLRYVLHNGGNYRLWRYQKDNR